MAGQADHRGVSLDLCASLPGARQRPCLWTRLHVSGESDGYPRSTDLAWIAMAEWLCRTSDRHIAPRMPGSNAHLRRGAPAASSFRLCRVLQSNAHALGVTERCALASSSPTIWRHCRYSDLGWAASPTRPDMIFGKDSRKNPTKIRRRPRINPQPLQPRPSPQPPRYLQAEPRCLPGRVASACNLNASDQHPSQARSGLSDNAILRDQSPMNYDLDQGPSQPPAEVLRI